MPPGNARAKECLEDNREQPGFSAGCKVEVEKMMESRAADFRLDPKLRMLCEEDIQVRWMPQLLFYHLSPVCCCDEPNERPGRDVTCALSLVHAHAMLCCWAAHQKHMQLLRCCWNLMCFLRGLLQHVCGFERDSMDTVVGYDARVIQCLQDYR